MIEVENIIKNIAIKTQVETNSETRANHMDELVAQTIETYLLTKSKHTNTKTSKHKSHTQLNNRTSFTNLAMRDNNHKLHLRQ